MCFFKVMEAVLIYKNDTLKLDLYRIPCKVVLISTKIFNLHKIIYTIFI